MKLVIEDYEGQLKWVQPFRLSFAILDFIKPDPFARNCWDNNQTFLCLAYHFIVLHRFGELKFSSVVSQNHREQLLLYIKTKLSNVDIIIILSTRLT